MTQIARLIVPGGLISMSEIQTLFDTARLCGYTGLDLVVKPTDGPLDAIGLRKPPVVWRITSAQQIYSEASTKGTRIEILGRKNAIQAQMSAADHYLWSLCQPQGAVVEPKAALSVSDLDAIQKMIGDLPTTRNYLDRWEIEREGENILAYSLDKLSPQARYVMALKYVIFVLLCMSETSDCGFIGKYDLDTLPSLDHFRVDDPHFERENMRWELSGFAKKPSKKIFAAFSREIKWRFGTIDNVVVKNLLKQFALLYKHAKNDIPFILEEENDVKADATVLDDENWPIVDLLCRVFKNKR